MKELQLRLYTVMVLSVCYFIMQIVFSHITHSLTVLMASYHMFCNIIALSGCILSVKYNYNKSNSNIDIVTTLKPLDSKIDTSDKKPMDKSELECRTLKNSYGWTRIDILTKLIFFIFLASLSFSLFVESFETLVHHDHEGTITFPMLFIILPMFGFIVNGLCFLLIGGYTDHQKNFLHSTQITSIEEVIIHKTDAHSKQTMETNDENLSKLKTNTKEHNSWIHGRNLMELVQDNSSTIIVLICLIFVQIFEDPNTIRLIDPILSIILCVFLVSISYPKMKSSCLILLQTIPKSIDMEHFEKQLISKFPEIVSYHDLHIWQLNDIKCVASIHIKFENPKLYKEIINSVKTFFMEHNVALVTIQPEFKYLNLMQNDSTITSAVSTPPSTVEFKECNLSQIK